MRIADLIAIALLLAAAILAVRIFTAKFDEVEIIFDSAAKRIGIRGRGRPGALAIAP
jgi:hypothetical protein